MAQPGQVHMASNDSNGGAVVPPANPETPSRRKLWFRAFTSVLLTAAFGVLAFSGAVLFVAPPGRIANWTGWRLVGLSKQEWIDIHLCFAGLFVAAVGLHLVSNYRPLLGYFKSQAAHRPRLRWSWLLALGLCVGAWACTRREVPPASWVLTLNMRLRRLWDAPRAAAPIPHAEELTLNELARQAGVPLDAALERLAQQGLRGATPDTIVAELAKQNRLTAHRVYEIIRGQVGRGRGGSGRGRMIQAARTHTVTPRDQGSTGQRSTGADRGVGRQGGGGPGAGFGRMTLAEFCQTRNLDLKPVQARLENRGIKARASQTLRQIADANGYDHPRQLVELIEGR